MNKLTKLLSVFIIAGAIGTGVAGVAGCNTKTDGHTHSYTYTDNKDGTHNGNCECGKDAITNEKHTDADKDGKCDKTGCGAAVTSTPTGDKFVIAANTQGLIVEGLGETSVTLSENKTSHSIDKASLEVYLNKGSVAAPDKGDKVPAANLIIQISDPSNADCDGTDMRKDGQYSIVIRLQNCEMAAGAPAGMTPMLFTYTSKVTVNNPVKADSLVVKTGDSVKTTQVQSADNQMVSTWTYEVTRANGDKEDVPASAVTVSGVSTTTVGEGEATLTYGTIATGKQTYTITKDESKVSQSFSFIPSMLTAEEQVKMRTEEVTKGKFIIRTMSSGEVAEHKDDSGVNLTQYQGKYFNSRLKIGGKSTGKSGNDPAERYIKFHADGMATLTVMAYANTGTIGVHKESDRLLAIYKADAKSVNDKNETEFAATGLVGTKQATLEKENSTHTFTIPEAGDYYLAIEVNDICITYLQLDQLVSSEGNEEITLTGETEISRLKVSHSTDKYQQTFTVGDTFSVDSGYTVKGYYANNATLEFIKEETVTEGLTYWLGETELTPGTTALTADLFANLGEQTVTIKSGNAVAATYTIVVESAVEGVIGVKASLDSSVETKVAAGASLELAKDKILVVVDGTNTTATIEWTATENGTAVEFPATLAIGEHILTITAQVSDGGKSAEFETTLRINVTAEGAVDPIGINFDDLLDDGKEASLTAPTTVEVSGFASNASVLGHADKTLKIKVQTNKAIGNDSDVVVNSCFSTQGAITTEKCALKLDLDAGAKYNITVYAKSGSSSDSNRKVTIKYGEDAASSAVAEEGCGASAITKHTLNNIDGGTIYIGGNGGIDIYYIVIEQVQEAAEA